MEHKLDQWLQELQIPYQLYRQYPFAGSDYVVDFLLEINGRRIVFECMGEQYHDDVEPIRDCFLQCHSAGILKLWAEAWEKSGGNLPDELQKQLLDLIKGNREYTTDSVAHEMIKSLSNQGPVSQSRTQKRRQARKRNAATQLAKLEQSMGIEKVEGQSTARTPHSVRWWGVAMPNYFWLGLGMVFALPLLRSIWKFLLDLHSTLPSSQVVEGRDLM